MFLLSHLKNRRVPTKNESHPEIVPIPDPLSSTSQNLPSCRSVFGLRTVKNRCLQSLTLNQTEHFLSDQIFILFFCTFFWISRPRLWFLMMNNILAGVAERLLHIYVPKHFLLLCKCLEIGKAFKGFLTQNSFIFRNNKK